MNIYDYEIWFKESTIENIENIYEFSIQDYQEQIETNGYLNAVKIA